MNEEMERKLKEACAAVVKLDEAHALAAAVRDDLIGFAYQHGTGIRELSRITGMAYASVYQTLVRDGHHVGEPRT